MKMFIDDLSFNGKHVVDMVGCRTDDMTCFAAAFLFVGPSIVGKGVSGCADST
jgi:hypothetical protein